MVRRRATACPWVEGHSWRPCRRKNPRETLRPGPRRDQDDRGRGHQRRDRDGRRLRDLRDAAGDDPEAVRRRPRRRDPDRRHDRPGRTAAGDDELLGDWNWYLPKWLTWLPRLSTARS